MEASLTVGELVQANREVLDILLRRPDVDPSRIVHHAVRALRFDVLAQFGPSAAADAQRAGAHRQAAEDRLAWCWSTPNCSIRKPAQLC